MYELDKPGNYDPLADAANKNTYSDLLKKQQAKQAESLDEADLGGEAKFGQGNASDAAKIYTSQSAGQTSGAGKLSAGLMAGSTMAGPAAPYLLAGGLALGALDQGRQQRQQAEDAKVASYRDYVARQQSTLNNLANFTQSMGIV